MSDETPRAQVFKYVSPEMPAEMAEGKVLTRLALTDRMLSYVQTLKKGGENNLHSHKHLDGFWMVLSGRCRFYNENDDVIADLGKHEGVMIPRNFKYWFESVGDETLELLQVEAFDIAIPNYTAIREQERINHRPKVGSFAGTRFADARVDSPDYGKPPRIRTE